MKTASLNKKQRLKSRKSIAELFDSGRTIHGKPLRILWKPLEQKQLAFVQMAVSVPKRHFKRAVDRNVLKRRIREAFRRNKGLLKLSASETGQSVNLMIIFTDTQIVSYQVIEDKLKELLLRLNKEISP
ncbi:MAG: ribonuclease P protein component [Flavobacteriales bacterium]|nr:ribonuclease P protein component [Flavobacteriales bacterium]